MKLNTRSLALVVAFGAVVTGASAQSFFFKYNGVAVGNGEKLLVLPSTSLKLEIWANFSDVTMTRSAGAGSLFVGFGKATVGQSSSASLAAAGLAGSKLDGSFSNLFLAPKEGGGETQLGVQGNAIYSGQFGSGTSNRWVGLSQPVIFPAGERFKPDQGSFRIADLTLTSTLARGESQLIALPTTANATSRSNLFTWNGSPSYRTPAADYNINVEAVPEPGTMIALGAGLAALAARRRRKA